MANLFATKPLKVLMAEAEDTGAHCLKRTLGPVNLVMLGIGAIIGAGLFVRTAAAIADRAGPSVVLAFIVAGIGCAFAGLCYAEFASMIPVAGSAYTYSYATMGEFVAWIIGWDLILEYAVGAATVAIAWSECANRVLDWFGWRIPYEWSHSPFETAATTGVHGIMNIPAVFILLLLTALLIRGTQGIGVRQWVHRCPEGEHRAARHRHRVGIHEPRESHAADSGGDNLYDAAGYPARLRRIMGILGAAGVVFFAYIGFDAVSTAAQEARNPKRDMPIGILGSLVICTVLYVLFSYVLSGVATVEDFRSHGREASVAFAIRHDWLRMALEVGDGRNSGRLLLGHSRDAARSIARLLFHESRRPRAEGFLRCAPEL